MYAVASIYTPDYQDLADLTDLPKIEYCNRHNYPFFLLHESKYSSVMGFNKIGYILDLLNTNPNFEWLLFVECDATITNVTIPIEDKIDNDYHVIIAVDRLNLNAGNLLVRNSPEGRGYLQTIMDLEPEYSTHTWAEQQAIIDTIDKYADIVKIVTQRYMNSYIQAPYDYCDIRVDIMGNSGEWQPGDWILHMPGLLNPARIAVMKEVLKHITR